MNEEQLYKISEYLNLKSHQISAAELIIGGKTIYKAEKLVEGVPESTMGRVMDRINEAYELSQNVFNVDEVEAINNLTKLLNKRSASRASNDEHTAKYLIEAGYRQVIDKIE